MDLAYPTHPEVPLLTLLAMLAAYAFACLHVVALIMGGLATVLLCVHGVRWLLNLPSVHLARYVYIGEIVTRSSVDTARSVSVQWGGFRPLTVHVTSGGRCHSIGLGPMGSWGWGRV